MDEQAMKEQGLKAGRELLAGMAPEGIQGLKDLGAGGKLMMLLGGAKGARAYLQLLIDTSRSMGITVLVEGGENPTYELHHPAQPDHPHVIKGEAAQTIRLKMQSIQNKMGANGHEVPRVDDIIRATLLATLIDAAETM